uniref:Uncharacterized protein n=1 Tax=Oryza nivara TaxID=4536 RepID=A0A0E0HJU9_ORYNI
MAMVTGEDVAIERKLMRVATHSASNMSVIAQQPSMSMSSRFSPSNVLDAGVCSHDMPSPPPLGVLVLH